MDTGKPMDKNTKIAALSIIVIVVIAAILYIALPKPAAAPADETASSTATSSVTEQGTHTWKPSPGVTAEPPLPLSDLIRIESGGIVSLYAGIDPSGRKVFTPVQGVDAASFKALSKPATVETPTEKRGSTVTALGTGSVAYYADKNRVYVLSAYTTAAQTKAALEVVQSADPKTFALTKSSWYAKDSTNVYRLDAPTNTGPYGAGSYEWHPYDLLVITDANPASFIVIDGTNSDAHDNKHSYRKGVVVGTYP